MPTDYQTIVAEETEQVVKTFSEWLYLPDSGALLTTMAAIVANTLAGDPVWLLNVGASGSGKTELLQPFTDLPKIFVAATLNEAALLSGSSKKDRPKEASGGLLRTIGKRGIILLKDFGSILSMREDDTRKVLMALREIYDGSWTRLLGTDGGVTLTWEGKVGLIAGCTQSAVEMHHTQMSTLGERFLYYRLPQADATHLARMALSHIGSEVEMRRELKTAVQLWWLEIQEHKDERAAQALSPEDTAFLVALSTFVAPCRTAIERHRYSRDIEYVTDPEAPGRISRALAQLLAGFTLIGVDHSERRRLIRKVGLDSIPILRRRAIEHLANRGTQTTGDIATALDCPKQTLRRSLEELAAYRVLIRDSGGNGKADAWGLSGWATKRLRQIQ